MDTVHLSMDVPRTVLAAMRQDAEGFTSAMRLAAAVKWYEMRLLSHAKAAEVAGLSREEFLSALAKFDVSPFQYDSEEMVGEVSRD